MRKNIQEVFRIIIHPNCFNSDLQDIIKVIHIMRLKYLTN